MWISKCTREKKAIVQEIELSSLVNLLRGSMDQKQNAARIVASVAEEDGYQSELAELGSIALLVDLPKIQSPTVVTMKALRLIGGSSVEQFHTAGGVDLTIAFLRQLVKDGDINNKEEFAHGELLGCDATRLSSCRWP